MTSLLKPDKYLKRQIDSAMKMLRHAVDNIPEEYWSWGKNRWFYSLTLYHIIETMEFYLASSPDDMKWGDKAGYEPQEVGDKIETILPLITKELILKYLLEIQNQIDSTYETLDQEKIATKDGFHWFGNIFEKHVYLLRHTQHHLGELALIVRQ